MKHFYSFLMMMFVSALSFTAKAASVTVYIDKADAVDFFVKAADEWTQTTLENSGDTPNTVEFSAETCDLQFVPIDMLRGIYTITKNGEDAKVLVDNAYLVSGVKDGDVIRVTVESPIADCTVSFAKGFEAIRKVVANGTEVTVVDNSFAAKTFDQVLLYPDEKYNIKSVDVNGKALEYVVASGCYAFNVLDEQTVVTIEAEEKTEQTRPVAFTLTDASAVGIYVSASAYRQGDKAAMDEGVVMVSSEKPYVQVEVADGYKIV